MKNNPYSKVCKICKNTKLNIYAHTAKCKNCGVLLCYPYPNEIRELNPAEHDRTVNQDQDFWLQWTINSGERNHTNFTNMIKFALKKDDRQKHLKVLDYGGGAGQFSLVLRSLYPKTEVFIVDLLETTLLDCYRPLNNQIKYSDFGLNKEKFDVIFLNDVYEHLTWPVEVLADLSKRLKSNGRIFIDTPCTFWLYSFTKILSKKIYRKLLKGTVDEDHQQIWTNNSFEISVKKANLNIIKYEKVSEFTQPAEYYLDNMNIKNPLIRFFGKVFYLFAPFLARNKIQALLIKKD